MLTVNMLDAKTHLSKLVKQVESGEVPEVIIARNGKPAAKLVRFAGKPAGQRIGIAKGRVEIPDDIDAGNAEIARIFGVGQMRLLCANSGHSNSENHSGLNGG